MIYLSKHEMFALKYIYGHFAKTDGLIKENYKGKFILNNIWMVNNENILMFLPEKATSNTIPISSPQEIGPMRKQYSCVYIL